jgi:outer membrane protein
MKPRILILLAGLLALPAAADEAKPAADGPRRISLDEAILLAAKQSPEVAAADDGVTASAARVKQVKAQRLPRLRVEANLLHWNEEIAVSFAPPGTPPDMIPPPLVVREQNTATATVIAAQPLSALLVLGTLVDLLVVREQNTATATVIAAQPLSALLVLGTLVDLEQAGVDASKAELDRAKLDAGARGAEAYLRLLQARAGRDVASKGVAQVEANLDRVRKLRAAGAAGDLDVLRLEAGRDAVKQGLLRAEAGVEIAQRGLVLALAMPEGTELDVVDDLPDPPTPPPLTPDQAADRALKRRPELRAARSRVQQASKGQSAARASLLPNIAAVGQYQMTEGMGSLQPADSWFVGVTLQWDIWDWGKNFAAVDEAAARKSQAKHGADALADALVFDARRRALDAKSAHESLAVAKSSLTAAEEAYRLQTIRSQQGVNTTTEVLDAETEVTRARTAWVLARYDYFLSLIALERAVGDLPSAP